LKKWAESLNASSQSVRSRTTRPSAPDHLEGVESGGLRRLDDQLLAAARVVADVVHEDAWSRAGEGHHCHHREARPLVTGTAAMVHVAISTP
jgi:hypothetical protein